MPTTGIRTRRTFDNRIDDTLKQVEDNYIRKAKKYTDKGRAETGNVGPSAIGGSSIPGASYLPISGKYGMIGSIAFNPTVVPISNNRINITPNQSGASKDSSYVLLSGQNIDTIKFIDGASKNGQLIYLQGTQIQIHTLRAARIPAISSISGLLTITVITNDNHNLTTGDKINILGTNNFNINDVEVTVTNPTTFTYSSIGHITSESAGTVQDGNFITENGEDVILDGTKSPHGIGIVPIIFDPTIVGNGAWRPAQTLGTDGLEFPVLYPQDDFGDQSAVTLMVDISGDTGQNKKIRLTGDVGFQFVTPPSNDVLQQIWVTFEQDGVGGHSINVTPTGLKNSALIDSLLDKSPNSKTTFRFLTEDGGATYRAELVDLKITNIANGTIQNEVIQWDVTQEQWLAHQSLTFGDTGPFADSGFIRLANDQILASSRNAADDGNIELKINGAGILDVTETANNPVGFQLRAQDAENFDEIFSIVQFSNLTSTGGDTVITIPSRLVVNVEATPFAMLFDENTLQLGVELDMGNKKITDVYELQIAGSSGTTIHGSVTGSSGILNFVSNATSGIVKIITKSSGGSFEQIVQIDDATGLQMLGHNIDMNNNFIQNLLNPVNDQDAATKFYVDNNSGLLSQLTIDTDKSWLGFNITDLEYIGSNAATTTGSGFIRMGTGEEIRMKNVAGTDDLIITSGNNALGVQALKFQVAGGDRLTISQFDIDVIQNDIINTGDVLPGGTGGEVGDSTNFYNQMHSQFFIPEGAAVILQRYGLAKTGNTLYINYDDANADAGFSIYEQGFESFRFYNPSPIVNEFHIGSSDVFTAGETYAIQMGENSNSNVRIYFTEGGNDLFIDRAGAGTTSSVVLSTASFTRFKVNVNEAKFFVPANLDGQDMINVVDIKSDGNGGATTGTIGELITADGGFNYYVRNSITWESSAETKIIFGSAGLTLETDDSSSHISLDAKGANSDVAVKSTRFATIGVGGRNLLFTTTQNVLFNDSKIILESGSEYIDFRSAVSGNTVDTPSTASNIILFNDIDTGELSVRKFGDITVSLEGGGDTSFIGFTADANLDMNVFDIDNTNSLEIVDSNGVTRGTISGNTSDFVELSFPTDEKFVISENTTEVASFSNTKIEFTAVDFDVNFDDDFIFIGSNNTAIQIKSNSNQMIFNGFNITLADQSYFIDFNSPISGGSLPITNINDRRLFYNSDTNQLSIKKGNGSVISLESNNTSFIDFSANANLDMNTFDINSIDRLLFDTTQGDFLNPSDMGITAGAGTMHFNLPDGGLNDFVFTVNGVDQALTMTSTTLSTNTIIPLGTNTLGIDGIPWDQLYVNGINSTFIVISDNLTLEPRSGDPPSLDNGRIWYDDTLNKFRAREDNNTVDVIGGSGGVSFPLRYTVTNLGVSGSIILDLNQTSGHYFNIGPINGDVNISFINPPVNNTAQAFRINITQGTSGGHSVTFNDTLLLQPFISLEPNGVTLLVGDIYDGNTFNIFTMTSTDGVISGGSSNLSDITIDVNKNWNGLGISNVGNLTDVKVIQIIDSGSTSRGTILGDSTHEFQIALPTSGKFTITDLLTPIFEINSTMLTVTTDSIQLNASVSASMNVGNTGLAFTTGDVVFSDANILLQDNSDYVSFRSVAIGSSIPTPSENTANLFFDTVTGVMSVKKFGNIIISLEGGANSISQGDTDVTVTDVGSGVVITTIDGNQVYSIQATRADYDDIPLFGITQINMNDTGSNLISQLTANNASLDLNIIDALSTFDVSFAGVDIMRVNKDNVQILSGSPNLISAAIRLFKDDTSPTVNDALGSIHFDGRNNIAQFVNYATLVGGIESRTDGSEAGAMTLQLLDNGIMSNALQMSHGSLNVQGGVVGAETDFTSIVLTKTNPTPFGDANVSRIISHVLDGSFDKDISHITTTLVNDANSGQIDFSVMANSDELSLINAMNIEGAENSAEATVTITSDFIIDLSTTQDFAINRNGIEVGLFDSSGNDWEFKPGDGFFVVAGGEMTLQGNELVSIQSINANLFLGVFSDNVLSFRHDGSIVGRYDGNDLNWVFNPDNNIILEPLNGNVVMGDDVDIIFGVDGTLDFDSLGVQTSATAGIADVVPNKPETYIKVKVAGGLLVIPAFLIA